MKGDCSNKGGGVAGVDAGCIRGRRRARFAIAARGRRGWRRTKGGIDEDDRNKPKKIVFVRRDVFSVFCRLCGKSREHQLQKKTSSVWLEKFSPRAFLLRKRGKTEEAIFFCLLQLLGPMLLAPRASTDRCDNEIILHATDAVDLPRVHGTRP